MALELTAVFLPASEGGYVAWIEEIPGANTQGDTLDEARENLKDAVLLLIETNREFAAEHEGLGSVIRERLSVDVPDPPR